MEKKITVVKGAKISIETTEDGSVITVYEPDVKPEFKPGDYIRWAGIYPFIGIIIKKSTTDDDCYACFDPIGVKPYSCHMDYLSHATYFERVQIDKAMKAIGKRWNEYHKCIEYIKKEPKDGDILVLEGARNCVFVYRKGRYRTNYYIGITSNGTLYTKGYNRGHAMSGNSKTDFATDEEKKRLFDALEKAGKKWNPETKHVENIVWKPEMNEFYWFLDDTLIADHDTWDELPTDHRRY